MGALKGYGARERGAAQGRSGGPWDRDGAVGSPLPNSQPQAPPESNTIFPQAHRLGNTGHVAQYRASQSVDLAACVET